MKRGESHETAALQCRACGTVSVDRNRARVLSIGIGHAASQTVVVTPEQETAIRSYVEAHPTASVEFQDVELSVGATVRESVELQTIDDPAISYRCVVVNGRTVLADPGTHKIVHSIG